MKHWLQKSMKGKLTEVVIFHHNIIKFVLIDFCCLLIAIKQELTNVDVLVCGLCHIGFHFVEEFQEHKDEGCKKVSAFRDQNTSVLI